METLLKKYFWLIDLGTIALCALLLGRAAASLIADNLLPAPPPSASAAPPPQSMPPPPDKSVVTIVQRNIFCSSCAPIEVPAEPAASDEGPVDPRPHKTTLKLQLLATMVAPEGSAELSYAVVRDGTDDRQRVFIAQRGDPVAKGAQVLRVVPGRLFLSVDKRVEYLDQEGLTLPGPPEQLTGLSDLKPLADDLRAGIRCDDKACAIDKRLASTLLANPQALMTSGTFMTVIKDGRPAGFQILSIKPDSFLYRLRFLPGDIVKAVNGIDGSVDPGTAYARLTQAPHLSVDVERQGATIKLEYDVR